MRGSTQFDTYRILIPGAIVLVLVDVAARLLSSLRVSVQSFWSTIPSHAASVRATIEEPFAALVIAFALGLLLYWLDPAYAAPEYHSDLPSDHLRTRLTERGIDPTVSVSLYMHAMNELMSDSLNDRVILMGAMYRIGFDTVFSTFVIGSVMVLGSALVLGPGSAVLDFSQLTATGGWLIAAIAATAIFVWRTRPDDGHSWSGALLRSTLLLGIAVTGILLFDNVSSYSWASGLLAASYAAIIAVWIVLRLRGPEWRQWLHTIRTRGPRNFTPSSTFELWEQALIDGSLVVSVSLLLTAVGGHLSYVQLAVPNVLLLTALVLAYLRKYERQLHAVYWNQRTWIDLNIDELISHGEVLASLKIDQNVRNSPHPTDET